ncbi:HAMP domain-containing protein, partial [Xanthomonas sp. Kuri4-1]
AIRLRVATRPVRHGGQRYTVQVARSDRMMATLGDYESRLYLRAGLATGLCALAVFCAVVFVTLQRMLRPVRRVSEAAAHIEPRNLSARLQAEGVPSELTPLIEAFNAALARLEAGYRVQQEFLAAAAHELKTPLALLRAEIELGGASQREALLRDTDLMARHVHQLLHLAEVSEGHNYRVAAVDPCRVAADAVAYLERLAARGEVRL